MNITWPKIAAVLGALVLLGGAAAAFEDMRFFAWRSDIIQLAGNSYGNSIARQSDRLSSVEVLISECEVKVNCSRATLQNLKRQKADIEREIKRLEAEEKKVK